MSHRESPSSDPHGPFPPGLTPEDASALDQVLASRGLGDGAGSGGVVDSQRLERVEAVLSLLERHPVEEPPVDLVSKTLGRIDEEERSRLVFAGHGDEVSGAPVAFRWRELVAVAAVLLIAVSLGWPVLSGAREKARIASCQSHQAQVARALVSYAGANEGLLPRYRTVPGNPWWRTGQPFNPGDGSVQSNSANLFIPVRLGHMNANDLSCPGNPHSARYLARSAWDFPNPFAGGYSYNNQFTTFVQRLAAHPRMVVLADRNPLLRFEVNGKVTIAADLGALASSRWHGENGQNVLFADGSTQWVTSPVVDGPDGEDNLWLPNGKKTYTTFTERPDQPGDSMLVQ